MYITFHVKYLLWKLQLMFQHLCGCEILQNEGQRSITMILSAPARQFGQGGCKSFLQAKRKFSGLFVRSILPRACQSYFSKILFNITIAKNFAEPVVLKCLFPNFFHKEKYTNFYKQKLVICLQHYRLKYFTQQTEIIWIKMKLYIYIYTFHEFYDNIKKTEIYQGHSRFERWKSKQKRIRNTSGHAANCRCSIFRFESFSTLW